MGEWADRAVQRYFSRLDEKRKAEEWELIRHHKLVAGAEGLWGRLQKFIKIETADFNRQMRPDFFKLSESENRIEVTGPTGSLKCWLDKRIPQLLAEHYEPPAPVPLTRAYNFGSRQNKDGQDYFFLIDNHDNGLDVEVVGAQLLDPLLN